VEEMVAAAAVTSASIQVVHISSMGLSLTPKLLPMIAVAQKRGLDITTECYPYTAFATGINSAVFDPGWQKRFGIQYADLQWAQTGERLTAETFEKYQKGPGTVIAHAIPEPVVRLCVASPLCMIASDGDIKSGKGHPRGAGTYCRVLGKYVREEKILTLMHALKKMTLMPARRLEVRVPAMKNKGRIRIGADADITVFDPKLVSDEATFDVPTKTSVGVKFLLVNGQMVVKDSKLQEKTLAGRPVRAAQIK
jgi:N-acyl-D-aspartate/D-glutamate deacylase